MKELNDLLIKSGFSINEKKTNFQIKNYILKQHLIPCFQMQRPHISALGQDDNDSHK